MKSLCGERNILKFNETHRTILFGPKAETFVSTLLREHCLELILGRIDREVPNVKSVARWVLICRVDWREIMSLIMLTP
jgi:hypothetical protein